MRCAGPTTSHNEIRRWAERCGAVPVELLPHLLDGGPAIVRFMLVEQSKDRIDLRVLPWEEFFLKFDELRLTFVYDEGSTGYNEILQIEEESPYRHPEYRPQTVLH